MILVDSSLWIDYFKGTITRQTEKLDKLLSDEPLAIGDLILTEVLQGFDNERDFIENSNLIYLNIDLLSTQPGSSGAGDGLSSSCSSRFRGSSARSPGSCSGRRPAGRTPPPE